MFDLKPLTRTAIPAALDKAHRYRLLNEPEQAQSICEDILRVDADHQEAITTLLLALADQFYGPRHVSAQHARDLLTRLDGEYERAYYAGLIDEREGIAWLRSEQPGSGPAAYQCFRQAMAHFERAEAVRPPANDDALLRWNSCARMIMNHSDVAPAPESVDRPVSMGD